MRNVRSIGISAAVAAVVTHGIVDSAVNFSGPVPVSNWQGFFRQMLLLTERLWSYAHGWQPMSHIRDFGSFFAPAVQLICPLIGFALFGMLARPRIGLNLWKPVAIALWLCLPYGYLAGVPGTALPWVEGARTIVIVALMAWSIGAITIPGADGSAG